jgi:hypothetical protein
MVTLVCDVNVCGVFGDPPPPPAGVPHVSVPFAATSRHILTSRASRGIGRESGRRRRVAGDSAGQVAGESTRDGPGERRTR